MTEEHLPKSMNFDRYTVALLIRRSTSQAVGMTDADRLQDAHMAHLAQLHERGKLVAAGPFAVDSATVERGFCIFACEVDEARKFSERDPLVRAGQLEYHFFPWMTPSGGMSFSRTTYPRSMSEAEQ